MPNPNRGVNPLATFPGSDWLYARKRIIGLCPNPNRGFNPLASRRKPLPFELFRKHSKLFNMTLQTGGLSRLRQHRINIPGARYFITCVTKNRKTGLAHDTLWAALLALCKSSEANFLAIVCMPDHLHTLFVLPQNRSAGEIVRTLKGPLSPYLRSEQLCWQKNFFEHRLRENEASEPYLRYMLCNPYQAQLIDQNVVWPYWKILGADAHWFIDKFPTQRPQVEWISDSAPWEATGTVNHGTKHRT
jgi:REP element-mobilizing transposase RayT